MPMHECVKKMYDQQRAKTGATYSSMMEGYGVLVSYMSELDAARKETKKGVGLFGPLAKCNAPEAQREALEQLLAMTMQTAATAARMAAAVSVYIDTVVEAGGGNLLDLVEVDE